MRTALERWQLRMFVVVTAAVLSITAIFYVQIPAQLGLGRYSLVVDLDQAGGLYPKSLVTYRGHEVGQVQSLELRDGGGIRAHLQIDDGARLPTDSVVQVRSASVIGEQYLNFLPSGKDDSTFFEDGDVVDAQQTQQPTTTNDLLTAVDGFLSSVPRKDLRTVVRELGEASDGLGADLGRLVDDSAALTTTASDNLDPTVTLLDDLEPVLETQRDLDPDIRTYAQSLDQLTASLKQSDADLRGVLDQGSATVNQISAFTNGLNQDLPGLTAELASTSEVANAYRDNIEHILIVLPPTVTMYMSATTRAELEDDYTETGLYFKMSFPPPCTQGFPEAGKFRDPSDLSIRPLPQDSYCKVPSNSPMVVRGARNNPCPNSKARGPSAASCGLIYDPEAVQRTKVLNENGPPSMIDPRIARLLAPNGPLFLLDPGATLGPSTWQALLKRMAGA